MSPAEQITRAMILEARTMRARARIAGMEAYNDSRSQIGVEPGYWESDFEAVIVDEKISAQQVEALMNGTEQI